MRDGNSGNRRKEKGDKKRTDRETGKHGERGGRRESETFSLTHRWAEIYSTCKLLLPFKGDTQTAVAHETQGQTVVPAKFKFIYVLSAPLKGAIFDCCGVFSFVGTRELLEFAGVVQGSEADSDCRYDFLCHLQSPYTVPWHMKLKRNIAVRGN